MNKKLNMIQLYLIKIIFSVMPLLLSHCLQIEDRSYFQNTQWSQIEQSSFQGGINGFYSYQDLNSLLKQYQLNFPELVTVKSIGLSGQQLPIQYIMLSKNKKKGENVEVPRILLVGAHETDNLITTTMCLYIIKRILYEYVTEKHYMQYLLETREIYLIPILNVDSYQKIGQIFIQTGKISHFDKNQNQGEVRCDGTDKNQAGVNLAFNYDAYFDIADFDQPCSPLFKGYSPLSEPETKSIANFISAVKFNIAINFFSLNNAIFYPTNGAGQQSGNATQGLKTFADYQIFKEFCSKKQLLPSISTFCGNRFAFSQEKVPGDPSDFMYQSHNIFALDVFIATLASIQANKNPSNRDDNPKSQDILNILQQNFNLVLYSIYKTGELIEFDIESQGYVECNGTANIFYPDCQQDYYIYYLRLQITNRGLSGSQLPNLFLIDSSEHIAIDKCLFSYNITTQIVLNEPPHNLNFINDSTGNITFVKVKNSQHLLTLAQINPRETIILSFLAKVEANLIQQNTREIFVINNQRIQGTDGFSKVIIEVKSQSSSFMQANTSLPINLQGFTRRKSYIIFWTYISISAIIQALAVWFHCKNKTQKQQSVNSLQNSH